MLYYFLVIMMLLILLQLFNYLGQNGVMVSTSFMYYQESNDKNTFELMAQSDAHKLQSILCEKGKDLADITEHLMAQSQACEHKKKFCVRKLN